MIFTLDDYKNVPSQVHHGALTIGNFDGVHRGHLAIIRQVRRLADEVSGPAVVFTFDPPPARLLRPTDVPEALTEIHRRAELLTKLGIDFVVVCPTTWELLQLEPEKFFEDVILEAFQAKAVAEGENFCFGRKRRGDIHLLKQLCDSSQLRFHVLEPQKEEGEWISSTRIRKLLEAGDIVAANRLLVEPHRILGKVIRGAARGRTLGFPTANLELFPVLCPPPGVYVGRVIAPASAAGKATAINIGPNPTFGENVLKVEAHLIDFEGDLYDQKMEIELLDKLRDVQKFESKEHLLAQLTLDVQQARSIALK